MKSIYYVTLANYQISSYHVYMSDFFTPINFKDSQNVVVDGLRSKISTHVLPNELKEKIEQELVYLDHPDASLAQIDQISRYVDWVTSLPWEDSSADQLDLSKAKLELDTSHYGLHEVKERILQYLSTIILQRQNNPTGRLYAPTLFLLGLAGTGKTTFAKSIALALGRTFVRIPFGGLASATDLRGTSRMETNAEPGAIIKSLRYAKVNNPIILLDELDRVSDEHRAEIMGVLIELLDSEQNNRFTDNYIDYPFDLSKSIFVASANNSTSVATAVLDRMEVIQMPSYTDAEKIIIAQKFVLPKMMRENGLPTDSLIITDPIFAQIARSSGYDPGIRSVERKIAEIVRKSAMEMVTKKTTQITVNEGNKKEYLSE